MQALLDHIDEKAEDIEHDWQVPSIQCTLCCHPTCGILDPFLCAPPSLALLSACALCSIYVPHSTRCLVDVRSVPRFLFVERAWRHTHARPTVGSPHGL